LRNNGETNMTNDIHKIIRTISFFMLLHRTLIAGSILSSKGFGIPMISPDARSAGMAGMTLAQSDPYSVSGINPSSFVSVRTTLVSLHLSAENSWIRTGDGNASSGYTNFDGFLFALPLKSGLGLAIQLRPLTRMSYRITSPQQLEGQTYTKSTEGRGGISEISLSAFWGINRFLSIGASGNYIFGKNEEDWKVLWDDQNTFTGSKTLFSARHSGNGWTAGLQLKPISSLILGGSYSPELNIDTQNEHAYYEYVNEATKYVLAYDAEKNRTQFPARWGFAAMAILGKTASWGIEYTEQAWNRFSVNRNFVPGTLKTQRIATGGEFFAMANPTAPYLKKMAYRIGFSYQPFFSKDRNGNRIGEWWATVGLGLPMTMGLSQIDAAIALGRRGSLSTNTFSETLFKFVLTVTVGEKWFTRVNE